MKTWKEQKVNLGMGKYAHLIRTRQELEALDPATTDSVFGEFKMRMLNASIDRVVLQDFSRRIIWNTNCVALGRHRTSRR